MDDPAQQVAAVVSGRADFIDLFADGQLAEVIDDLAVRYPTRLHTAVAGGTTYAMLNTRVPPRSSRRTSPATGPTVRSRLGPRTAAGAGPT